jgi:uncharacterized protein YbjT (DUF2867 family)
MSDGFRDGGVRRIAVAGATGRIGATLLTQLINDPVEVIPLTRDLSTNRLPRNTVPRIVDFDRPSTLTAAMEGAEKLFLSHGTNAKQVENEIALINAAVAAGVSEIVKVSVMGPPVQQHPFDWHMKIEAHLSTCDVGYTLLRPSTFMDTLVKAAKPVSEGSWGGAAAQGRVNLIDTRDVADVARVVLLNRRNIPAQRAYHLTGPSAVSMPEVAEELSRQLGREVRYQHRSFAEQREILIRSGSSEMVADLVIGLDRFFADSVLAETTSTVAELTGRAPRSVAGWLRDNISSFS